MVEEDLVEEDGEEDVVKAEETILEISVIMVVEVKGVEIVEEGVVEGGEGIAITPEVQLVDTDPCFISCWYCMTVIYFRY